MLAPRAAAAPPRRGRARRRRPARGRGLELHLRGRQRAGSRSPRRARAPAQPDERGAGGHAHARCSGRCSTPPTRNVRRGAAERAPVRGRQRLPAAGTTRARGRAGRWDPPAGTRGDDRLGATARCPTSAPTSAALLDRPGAAAVAGATPRRPPPTSSPPRACSRRSAARCASRCGSSRPAEPFLHPGRAARVLAGRTATAGWLGEVHPARGRPRWELERTAAAFEVDLGVLAADADRRPGLPRTSRRFPAVRQDLAVVVAEDVAGRARPRRRARRAAARCSSTPRCSTSTAAPRSATGACRWRCGCPSAPPDRTLTDDDVAPARARRSSPRLREELGGELRG